VLWLLPLLASLAGIIVLALLATRVRREIEPTERALRSFGRTVQPAVIRVREQTARTRTRDSFQA